MITLVTSLKRRVCIRTHWVVILHTWTPLYTQQCTLSGGTFPTPGPEPWTHTVEHTQYLDTQDMQPRYPESWRIVVSKHMSHIYHFFTNKLDIVFHFVEYYRSWHIHTVLRHLGLLKNIWIGEVTQFLILEPRIRYLSQCGAQNSSESPPPPPTQCRLLQVYITV